MAVEVMTVEVLARAKINLALHVVGRRADGYHLLDSLVAFASVGDRVRARAAPGLGLGIVGPMAAGLDAGPGNLVMRAAALMGGGAALELEKVLPVSSGIGGGSADAAATLQALATLGAPMPPPEAVLALGADVPVCLHGRAVRMQGIGEVLTPVTLPPSFAVLVNPGVAVSTPEVFRALTRRENPGLPEPIPGFADAAALATWLADQRNDLQPPAVALSPPIAETLTALEATPGCLLARMSGSGATCFGLFADAKAAETAARTLARPGWWVTATELG